MPFVAQTVSSSTIHDGLGNESVVTYEYEGGKFDFKEREMAGFRRSIVTDPRGTVTETLFHQDYIKRSLPYERTIKDGAGRIFQQSLRTYEQREIYDEVSETNNPADPPEKVIFNYLIKEETRVYDGAWYLSSPSRNSAQSYQYDDFGNVESDLVRDTDERRRCDTARPYAQK